MRRLHGISRAAAFLLIAAAEAAAQDVRIVLPSRMWIARHSTVGNCSVFSEQLRPILFTFTAPVGSATGQAHIEFPQANLDVGVSATCPAFTAPAAALDLTLSSFGPNVYSYGQWNGTNNLYVGVHWCPAVDPPGTICATVPTIRTNRVAVAVNWPTPDGGTWTITRYFYFDGPTQPPILPQLKISFVTPGFAATGIEPLIPRGNPLGDRSRLRLRVGCYNGAENVRCRWSLDRRWRGAGAELLQDTGHAWHANQTPPPPGLLQLAGTVAPSSGGLLCDDPAGCLEREVIYLSGEIPGDVIVNGMCPDGSCQAGESPSFKPMVRGLTDLRGTPLTWIMWDTVHRDWNSYVTPEMKSVLSRVARCWTSLGLRCFSGPTLIGPTISVPGVNDRLHINDLSLQFGGLHDINGQWTAAAGHQAHHRGLAVDFRVHKPTRGDEQRQAPGQSYWDVSETLTTYLHHLLKAHGFTFQERGAWPASRAADHWHGFNPFPMLPRPSQQRSSDVNRPAAGSSCSARGALGTTVLQDPVTSVYTYVYRLQNDSTDARRLRRLSLGLKAAASSGELPAGWGLLDSRFEPGDDGVAFLGLDDAAVPPGATVELRLSSPRPPGEVAYALGFDALDGEEDDEQTIACLEQLGITLGPAVLEPPNNLRVANVTGRTVTFRWEAPDDGLVVEEFVLEGGVAPGQTLVAIRSGSPYPILTLDAPTGVFYIRTRSRGAGNELSAASNEVRLVVGDSEPPSAPADLLANVSGSSLELSWRRTYDAGPTSGVVAEVSGSVAAVVPLNSVDTASFASVPPGQYTIRLRSINAAGTGDASAPLSFDITSACAGPPEPPDGFLLYRTGTTIGARWEPPTSGTAAVRYIVQVSGAFNGSFGVNARSVTSVVPAGTYTVSVSAANACGVGGATAAQTVVVP